MVKTQRGTTTSRSNTTDGESQMDKLNMMLESSDDEVPEEVTFEDSRVQALQSMKETLDIRRREKELLKEKRRKRQQLFQEQKKIKVLLADVLDKIDPTQAKQLRQCEDTAEKQDEKTPTKGKHKKRRSTRKLKGNCVVTTKEQESASYQLQAAKDFIHSRLYGPDSCRTTSHELLTLQNKKGRNKSAAVQFVRKNWASKEKAKAEKQRKRWVHRQQVVLLTQQ